MNKRFQTSSFLGGLAVGVAVMLIALAVMIIRFPGLSSVLDSNGLTFEEASALVEKVDTLVATIDSGFYEVVDTENLLDGAYHGVVDTLGDKYSYYMNEEEFEAYQESGSGSYKGIGVTIQLYETGGAEVISVNESGGAYDAGIQVGDVIIAADGTDLTGMTLDEIVLLVRGDEGTFVDLTYVRDGQEYTVSVERRTLAVTLVRYAMIDDEVGYLALTQFSESADEQFENALDDLLSQGMTKLVLDLRDNPGGRLNEVLKIADRILGSGLITYTMDKDGNTEQYYSDDTQTLDIPIVVLVNENSASASELLTGALKDRGAATVVGTTTFGKGIVQTTYPLLDGSAIKITTSRYYTPNGVCIHGEGITPDYEVELEEGTTVSSLRGTATYADPSVDPQLAKALEILKEGETVSE